MGKDLSRLPAIEKILQALGGHDRLPRPVVLATVREEIKDLRNNEEDIPPFDEVVQQVNRKLNALSRTRLAAVINGTGVLIHTNLGRSPLPERMAEKLGWSDQVLEDNMAEVFAREKAKARLGEINFDQYENKQ